MSRASRSSSTNSTNGRSAAGSVDGSFDSIVDSVAMRTHPSTDEQSARHAKKGRENTDVAGDYSKGVVATLCNRVSRLPMLYVDWRIRYGFDGAVGADASA